MVEVVKPQAETTICDPACGTGGFLLALELFNSIREYLEQHASAIRSHEWLTINI